MRSALVLNATYEPLSVVSARRAVCLVLADKAEVIDDDGTALHSPSLTLPSPLVIRLRYMVKVPFHRRTALSRRAVFARDDHRCQYCGRHGRLDRPRDAAVARRRARRGRTSPRPAGRATCPSATARPTRPGCASPVRAAPRGRRRGSSSA